MTTSHSDPKTDWSAFDAMSDDDVIARAKSDPDNPPLTLNQRAQLKPVAVATRLRWTLRLTQAQFAERFGIPLGTLRDWEQHKVVPDAAAQVLLRVIALNPDLVATAAKAA
jgi:putative transcriptional regulator